MQLLSSTNQLIAIGNKANSIIEIQLLQLIGSTIMECPSLVQRGRVRKEN